MMRHNIVMYIRTYVLNFVCKDKMLNPLQILLYIPLDYIIIHSEVHMYHQEFTSACFSILTPEYLLACYGVSEQLGLEKVQTSNRSLLKSF